MAYVNLPDGRKVTYVAKKMRQQLNRAAESVAQETREKFEQPDSVSPPSDPLKMVKLISLALFVIIVLILTFQRK